MRFLDLFRGGASAADSARPPQAERAEPVLAPRAEVAPTGAGAERGAFSGLSDPRLLEFIRTGEATGVGGTARSLRNMAVLRCVTLISEAMGMLPINLIENTPEKTVQTSNPAHKLLKLKPNDWQTPYEFKSLIQTHTLLDGQGFARVIWSSGRPIRLIPVRRGSMKPRLTDDWQMKYDYTRPDGGKVTLSAREVFHLRDLTLDGVDGISRIKLAREALGLAQEAEIAALRTFQTGVMAGGAIEVPSALSQVAYDRMQQSLHERHSGSANSGSFMLLEEGASAKELSSTAADAQQLETRDHQIEEVARAYGVPRPLLMMDDTSWGSGIEQLAIFFVQFSLAHWFTAWEQAAARTLLSDKEQETMQYKYNEHALLRGTLNDQANFFAKALGAGGQRPFMTQNEVRESIDLPRSTDPEADKLTNPMTQKRKGNEPPTTPRNPG